MSRAGVVIVGAGQAGFQTAASLREAGYDGSITLIGDEAALPYQRPPLSKSYLAGKTDAEGLLLRPAAYLDEHRITHRGATRAVAIDRKEARLDLSDGSRLAFDHLRRPPARATGPWLFRVPTFPACISSARSRMPTGCARRWRKPSTSSSSARASSGSNSPPSVREPAIGSR